jgi:Bromodomain/Bromodomain extra-terminal - transcription regulation
LFLPFLPSPLLLPNETTGLTDYPTIIKTPMDLGTIKSKIKKREYKTLYQVNEDVRIVWSNCMTYNADGSDFYKLAELLKKKWDEKYQKLLQEIGSGSDVSPDEPVDSSMAETHTTSNKSSLADKRNFAKLLYNITKEELGKILVDIEARHPAAIKRNATEDEVVLNIDEIPNPLLQELTTNISS